MQDAVGLLGLASREASSMFGQMEIIC